jgi:Domain of unknown function (DUF6894)
MLRYYFHLTDGKQVLDNHKGIDLPGNAAARTDAVALARDLKQAQQARGTRPPKFCHAAGWQYIPNSPEPLARAVPRASSRTTLCFLN